MKRKIHIQTNEGFCFSAPKPIICPHCGTAIEPQVVSAIESPFEYTKSLVLVTYTANCCYKEFTELYMIKFNDCTVVAKYPNNKIPTLPDEIKKISPRFVNMYNQCYYAETLEFFELAGSGYRNALEVLIKDYAINELKISREEVTSKRFAAAINNYLPTMALKQSADVVRVLGNDYTHYEQTYDEKSFIILKQYIEIFIQCIETDYLVRHPKITTQFPEAE